MRLEARKYLYDIQEAAGLASQFTAGKSYTNYQQETHEFLALDPVGHFCLRR
jgi:uncharacterized protein with HEPN domain